MCASQVLPLIEKPCLETTDKSGLQRVFPFKPAEDGAHPVDTDGLSAVKLTALQQRVAGAVKPLLPLFKADAGVRFARVFYAVRLWKCVVCLCC